MGDAGLTHLFDDVVAVPAEEEDLRHHRGQEGQVLEQPRRVCDLQGTRSGNQTWPPSEVRSGQVREDPLTPAVARKVLRLTVMTLHRKWPSTMGLMTVLRSSTQLPKSTRKKLQIFMSKRN